MRKTLASRIGEVRRELRCIVDGVTQIGKKPIGARKQKKLKRAREVERAETAGKLTYQQRYAVFGKLLPPHVFNNHRQQLLDRFCPLLNRGA